MRRYEDAKKMISFIINDLSEEDIARLLDEIISSKSLQPYVVGELYLDDPYVEANHTVYGAYFCKENAEKAAEEAYKVVGGGNYGISDSFFRDQ